MDFKISDTAPGEWDDFVENHPNGKIYHLSQWNELIRNIFGHPIKYIVLENGRRIEGILPLTEFKSFLFGKFSVSLPFINYGGILTTENDFPHEELAHYLKSYLENGRFDFIELRMDEAIKTTFPVKTHKVTFRLDLPDNPDALWNSLKAKLRNQIRRPTKESMYAVSGSLELLDDFYKVYSINMRDLGTPALPKSFFRNILKTFPANAFIVSIYTQQRKPVAVSFLIQFNGVCEIPWASSLKEYNRFSPNMLLYWESLKSAVENKNKTFDFGRCTPGSGTYRFKKQWNANEKPLYWYYVLEDGQVLPEINPSNPKYKWLISIWQKLPISIVNIISPLIIKNIP